MKQLNSVLQLAIIVIVLAFTAAPSASADTRAHVEYSYITPGTPGTPNVRVDLIIDRFQDGGGTSFWVRVRQSSKQFDAATNRDRINEVVSIRDFPAAQYRKVIGHLRNVRDWDAIVQTGDFCDERFRTITVNRKRQSVSDACVASTQSLTQRLSIAIEPIEPQMVAAIRTIDRLVEQTISSPDVTYVRDRVNQLHATTDGHGTSSTN